MLYLRKWKNIDLKTIRINQISRNKNLINWFSLDGMVLIFSSIVNV